MRPGTPGRGLQGRKRLLTVRPESSARRAALGRGRSLHPSWASRQPPWHWETGAWWEGRAASQGWPQGPGSLRPATSPKNLPEENGTAPRGRRNSGRAASPTRRGRLRGQGRGGGCQGRSKQPHQQLPGRTAQPHSHSRSRCCGYFKIPKRVSTPRQKESVERQNMVNDSTGKAASQRDTESRPHTRLLSVTHTL